MARKSTIPNPDDYIPSGEDLIEGVVQRRRERAGRTRPEDTTQPRTHATTQSTEDAPTVESVPATVVDSTQSTEVERLVTTMKATTDATLNTRIPAGYKEWLDTQAFKGRHQGVTIQSQTEEAIADYIKKKLMEG